MKEFKFRIQASALGNYFGVGFTTPQEQFEIDNEGKEKVFTEEEKNRMLLGSLLENSVLDYFENFYGIKIDERNEERLEMFEGMITGKVDGMTIYNGERTVVECKVSNSSSTKFVDSKSYQFQIQAYMYHKDVTQALLLGLQNGKPIAKLFKRNDDIIEDIKAMAEHINMMFVGMETEIPQELIDKYSEVKNDKGNNVVADSEDEEKMLRYLELKASQDSNKEELDSITNYFKDKYRDGKVISDKAIVTLSSVKGRTSFDKEKLMVEHPELDLDNYNKVGEPTRSFRIK